MTTTSSALTISSVQATDAGIYKYTVANSYGTTNAYGSLAIGKSFSVCMAVYKARTGGLYEVALPFCRESLPGYNCDVAEQSRTIKKYSV